MKTSQLSLVAGAVCRHPNGSVEHFLNDMEATFSKIPQNQTCFFVGETLINLMKYDNNMSVDYFTSLSSNNFIPYISNPTRITDTSATLIDHIFTKLSPKHLSAAFLAGNLISDISDHLPNFLIWENTSCAPSNNIPLTRLFSDKNICKFRQHLDSVDWNHILTGDDADYSSGVFTTVLSVAVFP